jgi:hypothetical protein
MRRNRNHDAPIKVAHLTNRALPYSDESNGSFSRSGQTHALALSWATLVEAGRVELPSYSVNANLLRVFLKKRFSKSRLLLNFSCVYRPFRGVTLLYSLISMRARLTFSGSRRYGKIKPKNFIAASPLNDQTPLGE